jgi:hypothetical protein
MSGIDASGPFEWPAAYCGGHSAATCSIAALGWTVATPLVVIIAERLAAHQGEFLQTRWLMAGLSIDDPRVGRRLFQLHRHHGLNFVEAGQVVCIPPATPEEWQPVKAAVLRLIGPQPIAYTAIRARARLPEASIQTALQILSDDRTIEAATPGGPEAWTTMAFTRA